MIDHKERCRDRAPERLPDVIRRIKEPRKWTYKILGKRWNVTPERARQVVAKAERNLRRQIGTIA